MPDRDPLHERILETERRYRLLEGAGSVVVGVSGGQDSVALLHALAVMDEFDLRLGVAHLHHGMRGESADKDHEFVEDLAGTLGAAFYPEWRDVIAEGERDGLNAEVAGRRARYSLYARVLTEGRYDRIATGHTGTDRAETLLLNLFRGAGLEGMRSIPPRRGRIVRPLIACTRDETRDYCERHGLPYRTDITNLQPEHARRNALRLEILPHIRQMFPEVERALIRACETVEEELEWTDPLLSEWLEAGMEQSDADLTVVSGSALAGRPAGALHRMLRMALEEARGDLYDISREQVERVAELVTAGEVGAEVELPGGWVARRGYERLELARSGSYALPGDEAQRLEVPGSARLERRGVEVTAEEVQAPERLDDDDPMTVFIDAGAAANGLVLRSWDEGERIQPLGMEGSKKLSDLFTDEKIERQRRPLVPVVARPNGEILWVVGYRISETARATPGAPAVKLTAWLDNEWEGRGGQDDGTQ